MSQFSQADKIDLEKEALDWMRENSKKINSAAYDGDNDAMNIIRAYHLHNADQRDQRCRAILNEAIQIFRKQQSVKP